MVSDRALSSYEKDGTADVVGTFFSTRQTERSTWPTEKRPKKKGNGEGKITCQINAGWRD